MDKMKITLNILLKKRTILRVHVSSPYDEGCSHSI